MSLNDGVDATVEAAIAAGDYETVIAEVRSALDADRVAAMTSPVISGWIARRYRNIFIEEATCDPEAVKHSQRRFPLNLSDKRDAREQVAQRMFRKIDESEIHAEMPKAKPGAFANTTLLFAPGLLTGYLPELAFQSVFPQMKERFGVRILAADSAPLRSSKANVADLVAAMDHGIGNDSDVDATLITAADNPTPPGDMVVMGYSKGSPDLIELLVARPDIVPRIKAFISWNGAHGGSYIANQQYDRVKDIDESELVKDQDEQRGKIIREMLPFAAVKRADRRIDEIDIKGAIYSLTTGVREAFCSENADYLASLGIPSFYCTGSTSLSEVPYYERSGVRLLDKYDKENDMQLTQLEATPPLPNSLHLALWHATHWDVSYDAFPWYDTLGSHELEEPFTRYSAMAAMLLLMSELGLMT